ncbi:MAG: DNA repair protein RadA, partial [Longimicrobiales bacterium]
MAKLRTLFFCTECGNETPRWQGQCPACSAWNTLAEEPAPAKRTASALRSTAAPGFRSAAATESMPVRLADVDATIGARWPSGIGEFDFVLGGGVVPGSLVLIGGEPGIGKSTLLLQV